MTKRLIGVLAICGGALALAGCAPTMNEPAPSMRTGSAADEGACLAAVRAKTGNSAVVLSSDFSQAATEVMVGVGPQKAPWRCLVSGGKVTEVMSMTNEGTM